MSLDLPPLVITVLTPRGDHLMQLNRNIRIAECKTPWAVA